MPAPRVRRLNVRNGMLDLDTLELHTHDPKYLSKVQLPVEWAPDATCPTYEWWVDKLLAPGQRDDRLPDPG
jgi:putative DNA primase/helicase